MIGKAFVDLVVIVDPHVVDYFVADYFIDTEAAEPNAEALELILELEQLVDKIL